MEELLRELVAVNKEMLSELKMLREALCREPGLAALALTEPGHAAQSAQTGQFAQAGQSGQVGEPGPCRQAPPRYTPEDLEDIRGSLMDGLKKRNREKSNAISEFEKRHKDW